MSAQPVFRFAPSPNGELHLGHACSALLNFELARRTRGRFLLRIEDIDTGRSRPEFIRQIFDDLAWLGLTWEEPVRRQSEHFQDYARAVDVLSGLRVLYPCFASRKEIEAASTGTDPDGAPLYPGSWLDAPSADGRRRIAAGQPHTLRLNMDRALEFLPDRLFYDVITPDDLLTLQSIEAHPARWGDAVIVRKDTPTSYHLSVVVDDALQSVTHVVRGKDLEAATDLHVLLQRLLGLPTPRYHHHRLITDVSGRKLAKSLKDTTLRQLRADGATPDDVRRMLA